MSILVFDLSQLSKKSSHISTGSLPSHRKKRKKTIVIPKGMTKEEYFSKLDNF